MKAVRYVISVACTAALLCAGCAVSPEAESRRLAIQADIAEILSMELDPAEYGETKRCLSDSEYRSFRALDDRHILFDGRRDRQWINTLRSPCHDLRFGEVLVVRSFSSMRMCDRDTFQVADWFEWPWYRRWPWDWGNWGGGMRCSLGEFQPVTQGQVEEIESLLKSR